MYTEQEIEQIVSVWNDNRDADTQKLKDNRSLRDRYLAPRFAEGYTATQLQDVLIYATTADTIKKPYDALTKKYVRAHVNGTPEPREPEPTPAPTTEPTNTEPAPATEPTTPAPAADALTTLIVNAARPAIVGEIKNEIAHFAATGAIEKPLTIITPSGKTTTAGKHEVFDRVLSAVANHVNLYLYGPAGSGKNVICKQVADALGLEFYYTNNVMQEHQLKGYSDANGVFHDTPFYKAFKNGGLFMLDELDASIPQALTMLNAAISNKYFVFGNGEQVTASDNFYVIAAGNTIGTGANTTYTGRARLDGATLNRFRPVFVDYSKKIEDSLAPAEIVRFCREFRKACKKCGIEHITSYRNIIDLNMLSQIWPARDAVQSAIVGELSQDDLNMLREHLDETNKYAAALYA